MALSRRDWHPNQKRKSSMTTRELYNHYATAMRRIADIRNASAVLQWDQETHMPAKGAELRGQQISTLAEMSHQLFSDEKLGDVLQDLTQKDDLTPEEKSNVELTLEDYVKNKKYSSDFVRKLSDQVNKAFHSWIEARKENSFAIFKNDLARLIQLKREEADILGYDRHPYDAHLNEYDKGSTVAQLDQVFETLLPQLKSLLDQIVSRPQVDDRLLKQHFPKTDQWNWGMHLIQQLHFDFESGRQDISEHPFSISFPPGRCAHYHPH
jgi:carboxypeptidase Taq